MPVKKKRVRLKCFFGELYSLSPVLNRHAETMMAQRTANPVTPTELDFKTASVLETFYDFLQHSNRQALGYPTAKAFDYSSLYRFLGLPLNNCGDPYEGGTYKLHSRAFEQQVIAFFSRLFRAEGRDIWGYVTNGGTEGNLYGLYLARQHYSEAKVYYSQATHYSVAKNINLLQLDSLEVPTLAHDEIDYEALGDVLDVARPAVVVANIGTTMREARDDVGRLRQLLRSKGVPETYIHCDAALDGLIAPFLDPRPSFDFADGADSIAVSGHKFIGCPIPCGVVLCERSRVEAVRRYIPYINGYDETISGSRNGITPLFLWHALAGRGEAGLRREVQRCLALARYAHRALVGRGVGAERNQGAITVTFPRPSAEVEARWQLACQGEFAHIVLVPGVGQEMVDGLVADVAHDLTPAVSA
jgi:histidine decarboxylase